MRPLRPRRTRIVLVIVVVLCVVGGVAIVGWPALVDGKAPASETATNSAHVSGETPPSWWQPAQGLRWSIQLTGEITVASDVQVIELDGEETSAETVSRVKARGAVAVCYFNAGAWEDWRVDAARFSDDVKGEPLDGWPGERWLDIRQVEQLSPIMAARMDTCRSKGFAAVDPDNLDGYVPGTNTGFAIAESDAVEYQQRLGELAHDRGLAIGLKNAPDIISEVRDHIDFATNESCLVYDECGAYAPLTSMGKPVLHIEYRGSFSEVCSASPAGFSTVLADRSLDRPPQIC